MPEEKPRLWRRLRGLFAHKKQAGFAVPGTPVADTLPQQDAPPTAQQLAAQAEHARLAAESMVPQKGHRLYELYCRLHGTAPMDIPGATLSLALFMEHEAPPTREQKAWLQAIEREAKGMLQYSSLPGQPPANAVPMVRLATDGMSAWLFILPPAFEGEALTTRQALAAIRAAGVTFGVDEDKVDAICSGQKVLQLHQIAQGTPPVDGTDGAVVDLYRRGTEIHLTVRDDNTVDYKDLGWLQTVFAGESICEIIPPTPAMPGQTVHGQQKPGKNGKAAQVPGGAGTVQNRDGTALVASIDGVVSFMSQRFRVDPLLIIKGDVDLSCGNLDVVGDVLVYGDVLEGYKVAATGNVTVQGMVEGAQVKAGGNLQIGRGMNGNSQGVIEAAGSIFCKFIENGTAICGGSMVCDTIINSRVSSDDTIQVRTGRASIIGGSVIALNKIEAGTIGNQGGRSIEITLGSALNFIRERQTLEQQIAAITANMEGKQKNIAYLQGLGSTISADDARLLENQQTGLTVQKMQLANLKRRLLAMTQREQSTDDCRLVADTLHPPMQLTIGKIVSVLRKPLRNTVVMLKNGEIKAYNIGEH